MHTITSEDEKSLVEPQRQKLPYFIKKVIGISEGLTDVQLDNNENKIVKDIWSQIISLRLSSR